MRSRLTVVSGRLPRPVLLCHNALRRDVGRAMYVALPTRSLFSPPSKAPEVLQVELLVADELNENNNNNNNNKRTAGEDDYGDEEEDFPDLEECGTSKDTAAETIYVVDAFARAKVANFVKRMLSPGGDVSSSSSSSSTTTTSASSGVGSSSQLVTEVREVQTADDDEMMFHARVRLPLPPAYGDRWGEGLAPSEKEAELVACMHAERLIDALGLPMFQLTSKQKRHAEAAREAGRWAPMPGDAPRPPTTPSPPRLQLLREGGTRAVERRLQIDKMVFADVTEGAFSPMKLTLASPFFLDYRSLQRIKQFFMAYKCNIQRYCRVTPIHKCTPKEEGSYGGGTSYPTGNNNNNNNDKTMFVVQLKLPIDGRFGERIACGKASTKKEAIALACMHAELIIDALGLALYPSSREKQELHAEECRKVNRWCSRADDCEYNYAAPSPPPLRFVKESSTPAVTELNTTASLESILTSHTKAINSFTNVTEVKFLDTSARAKFMNYLKQHSDGAEQMNSHFFLETLGIKAHEVYRATVTVPVPKIATEKTSTDTSNNNNNNNNTDDNDDFTLQSFVAIGIGTSEAEAETAASMHALSVLKLLNRPIVGDGGNKEEELMQRNLTRNMTLPAPYRYVVGHVGRIMVPGLMSTRNSGTGLPQPAVRQQHGASSKCNEMRLRSAQEKLPRSDWSLDADADGYIILSPSVNAQEGRNYVHTLPSVRQVDRFAIVRLRDYMERHGKRLESTVSTSVVETDEGLKRWVKKITLPVPEAFGHVVAHGEAYVEEEALIMSAVHAELVLDEIGVALYDMNVLQGKHCDTAVMLGRRAPYETQSDKRDDVVVHRRAAPPPVRKEHEGSCLWARLAKERSRENAVTGMGEMKGAAATTTTTTTRVFPSAGNNTRTPVSVKSLPSTTTEEVASPVKTRVAGSSSSSATVENMTDDDLCDLAGLVSVHHTEFFRHAPRLLEMYCRRKGVEISRCMRQYNVPSPISGFIHRAILELPVPSQFGRRYAVGCASAKKDAFLLCCMHAVYTLGELGIPVYTGQRQAEYAAMSESKGHYAPKPGDPLKEPGTKSPPGLKCLPNMQTEKPQAPTPPDRKECQKSFAWTSYVTACRGYIQKTREQLVLDALFIQGKAPRSGVDVEDNGLDVVEALPLFTNAKTKLAQKCAAAKLPVPPPLSFRFEAYGRHPHRRFLVEQPVLGTPFVARGMGEEGRDAVTRAVMHYEYIVGIIGGGDVGSGRGVTQRCWEAGPAGTVRNRHGDLFDPALRDFTPRGKLCIMALYTTLRPPFVPLRLTLKERGGTGAEGTLVHISLIEMEDETGLRMAGKGEDRMDAEKARSRAIAELYRQLQHKPAFQAVAQLLQTYPALRAEGAAQLLSEARTITEVQSLLAKGKDSCASLSSPLLSSSDFSEWRGSVGILLRGGQQDNLNSPELQLLVDLVEHLLGCETKPAPLTLPATTRHLLSAMGLVTNCSTNNKMGSEIEANATGVAVSLFASCIPPLSPVRKGVLPSVSAALPLQLSKLLVAGSLLNCLQLCIRVVALVLFSITDERQDVFRTGDVVELAQLELPLEAKRLATVIATRLHELLVKLTNLLLSSSSSSCTLQALIDSSRVNVEDTWGPLQEKWTRSDEGRLRLAVSFATFPRAFVQRRIAASDGLHQVTIESKDHQRTARVTVPPVLSKSCNFSSSDSSSPSYYSSSTSCHSHFPCFTAFDGVSAREGVTTTTPPLLGTFLPPCGLLLATACCDDPRAVVVAGEVPNVAVVDGFLPVVMQSAESLAAVVELRLALAACWSALRPLPADVQNAAEKLMGAEHSLAHVLQADLLV